MTKIHKIGKILRICKEQQSRQTNLELVKIARNLQKTANICNEYRKCETAKVTLSCNTFLENCKNSQKIEKKCHL